MVFSDCWREHSESTHEVVQYLLRLSKVLRPLEGLGGSIDSVQVRLHQGSNRSNKLMASCLVPTFPLFS